MPGTVTMEQATTEDKRRNVRSYLLLIVLLSGQFFGFIVLAPVKLIKFNPDKL